MSLVKSLSLFLFSVIVLAACTSRSAEVAKPPEKKVYRVPYDTLKDDLTGFISGKAHGRSGCLALIDSTSDWNKFRFTMDSGFAELDTSRFGKMKVWADSELVDRNGSKTLFYPFGGPDILNANIFYPKANKYILIGLEPVGELPDFCKMSAEQVNKYLGDVWYSLKDIFKRSYFITGNMIGALKKNSVNGAVPVMSLFLKRNGYHIVSLEYVAIDKTGSCLPADSVKNSNGITNGVKIDFAADTGRLIQSVYYFKTDLSDVGLKANQGFQIYLSQLPECHTYLKAASYLMHGSDFSSIRNLIFEKSTSILQDDSGIAYRYFDKNTWSINLYGKYMKPGKEFSWINETDLAKAYEDTTITEVPFTLGYNWRTQAINLLYAVRK